MVLEITLAENLHLREVLTNARPTAARSGPFLRPKKMVRQASDRLEAFGVHPPDPRRLAEELSGGNQQKVLLARELAEPPRAIVAHNPTRGLDVSAAAAVHNRLLQAAREGRAGVLLVSSDLDEVLLLGDRVAVLFNGQLELIGERGVGKDEVGRAMVGAAW